MLIAGANLSGWMARSRTKNCWSRPSTMGYSMLGYCRSLGLDVSPAGSARLRSLPLLVSARPATRLAASVDKMT